MTALDRLIKTLQDRGLSVHPGDQPDQLLLSGPAIEKTPDVVEAVKVFKPLLLKWAAGREPKPAPAPQEDERGTRCRECKSTWYCSLAEIREAVQSPHYCGQARCPFREAPRRNGS